MARVEWGRLEPGDVEHAIAMMLSRENPEALRVRPSRGDGGIDVLVPSDDGVTVYQVKAFSNNLTAGQKRQIVKSLDRVQAYAQARGLTITRWLLTLPLDATPENLEWLDEQAQGRPFTVGWRGLTYVDGLAGQYPTVIDYYLGNGKERLEGILAQLTDLLRSQLVSLPSGALHEPATGRPLSPADVTDSLMSLHGALNAHDPHFRYDFAVDAERPDILHQPGLVASAQESDGARTVTVKVFAYSTASLEERPIPINLRIRPGEDPDLQQAVQAFHQFGEPFEAPFGTADFDIDLPGGLGGSYTGGRVVVSPVDGGRGHDTRWQILGTEGTVVDEVLTHMQASTRGFTGNAESARGTEVHGVFDIRTRTVWDTGRWEITLSRRDISGLDPANLLAGLRFLDEFRRPNLIRPAVPRGPANADPIPIDATPEPDPGAQLVLELVTALTEIQEHTTVQLSVPDLETFTTREAREVIEAAALLRGETLTASWTRYVIHHTRDEEPQHGPFTAVFYLPLTVSLESAEILVGYRQIHLPAARFDLESITPHEDHLDVAIIPLDGARANIRFAAVPAKTADQPSSAE